MRTSRNEVLEGGPLESKERRTCPDAKYVDDMLADIVGDEDLSRYIL